MKSETFEGVGHGKLILTGEHSVVYGYPAIAFGVTTCTRVQLRTIVGPSRVASEAKDSRLDRVIEALCPSQFEVTIRSDLPLGRGMGSSAALSVGLARALAQARGQTPSLEGIYAAAMEAEAIFHTNPSGLDARVSASGGVLRFERGTPPTIEQLTPPSWSVIVLDSGIAGNTSDMVKGVAARRPAIDSILDEMGELTASAQAHLHDPQALGEILTQNQTLLQKIGVSTPRLDALTQIALRSGALGAKLSGAGGGGVVIAITTDPDAVLHRIREQHNDAFVCTIWTAENEEWS